MLCVRRAGRVPFQVEIECLLRLMPIVAATADDEADVRRLLDASGLPTADLTTDLLRNFLVQRDGADLVAVGGLEFVGKDALLRSVAVAQSQRNRGLGLQLVQALEAHARARGCRRVYLLTTTAERYFGRFGYERVARDTAPPGIRATKEFSSLCPSTSSMMTKTMEPKILNVLFLCTHNSARSIMAEVILNYLGRGKFKGYSAGSHPGAAPNPFALETLRRQHLPTEGLYSKDWNEFATPGAPVMDFVFTVCDQAAGEMCPVWPGQPMTAHWGVEDPSQFQGTDEEKRHKFATVASILKRRIELFTSLPIAKLDRLKLQQQLRDIGKQ